MISQRLKILTFFLLQLNLWFSLIQGWPNCIKRWATLKKASIISSRQYLVQKLLKCHGYGRKLNQSVIRIRYRQ